MRKYNFFTSVIIFLMFSNSFVYSQNNNKYLDTAEKTANWLMSIENVESQENNIVSWPESNILNYNRFGIDVGAAGIGLFFLKLYNNTNNTSYLSRAEGAANFIYTYSKRWWGPDWLNGVAGYGHLFLEIYKKTGDVKYLNYSIKSADWLIDKVSVDNNSNYYWKNPINPTKLYTGLAHGAAGIGIFFLELYEITNNNDYLVYAEGTFNWLTNHTIRFDENSIGWKRLTSDDNVYNLWCGGTVGIMFFLEKLYQITNEEIHKDYLVKSANGLVKYSNKSNNICKWKYSPTGSLFPIAYCHGTSSVSHILFKTFQTVGDSSYLNIARFGMNWLKSVKKVHDENEYYWSHIYNWNQFHTGFMTGTAGIGYSFIEAYKIDPNKEYLNYATGAADYLISIADNTAKDQYRWINFTNNSTSEEKQYYTGWYSGAAGIGIFLLDLHQTLNSVVSIKDIKCNLPNEFKLKQNYPNPFNPQTIIKYSINHPCNVNLRVYNLVGEEVKTILNKFHYPGMYSVIFDGRNLPSGVYYYRIISDNFNDTKKMILIK